MGPERGHVRNLFLRLLGVITLLAFWSLGRQVVLLYGDHGLLPACPLAARVPTLFSVACSDQTLFWGTVLGGLASLGLVLLVAPRWCLIACWLLYVSYARLGQEFLSFQWDNLLLETLFFALFVTPGGLVGWRRPAPPAIGVFLMLWLLLRLQVESGAAKLLLGDPTWRELTAMATYYETAPLPTWVGWYAHQLPEWVHRLTSLATLVVELVVPFGIFGPRRLRTAAALLMAVFQVGVILTANYGFFNYLTLALCLWALDDGQLAWLAARLGRRLEPLPPPATGRASATALAAIATVLVVLSAVPFLPLVPPLRPVARRLAPLRAALDEVRSINAYHLFAQMTLERREPVLEGSDDGLTWMAYEFRYKPGDPDRAPPFVAPHQPRVDFQLWFLLLGRGLPRYLDALLQRLLTEPAVVAPLFSRDPFPETPPRLVRLAVWRYRFSDAATRRQTGAWWVRELEGYSRAYSRPPNER